jgi:hypothetical protein
MFGKRKILKKKIISLVVKILVVGEKKGKFGCL